MNQQFWNNLDALVTDNGISIDRAKGSAHPRYPEYIYPLDYGYINDTKSADGAEIDIWKGSHETVVVGIIVTLDPIKKDSEIKVLIGCSASEQQQALAANNRGTMSAILITR